MLNCSSDSWRTEIILVLSFEKMQLTRSYWVSMMYLSVRFSIRDLNEPNLWIICSSWLLKTRLSFLILVIFISDSLILDETSFLLVSISFCFWNSFRVKGSSTDDDTSEAWRDLSKSVWEISFCIMLLNSKFLYSNLLRFSSYAVYCFFGFFLSIVSYFSKIWPVNFLEFRLFWLF